MIIGSDYLEINHQQDVVTITIRENGVTATAHLSIDKAILVSADLKQHLEAAHAWRPPSLTEYTGLRDSR